MIGNIIDHRKRPYRWKVINAVVENTWHDNSCADSDQASRDDDHSAGYAQRKGVSLQEAIKWAEAINAQVTLYIYDEGDGI